MVREDARPITIEWATVVNLNPKSVYELLIYRMHNTYGISVSTRVMWNAEKEHANDK